MEEPGPEPALRPRLPAPQLVHLEDRLGGRPAGPPGLARRIPAADGDLGPLGPAGPGRGGPPARPPPCACPSAEQGHAVTDGDLIQLFNSVI